MIADGSCNLGPLTGDPLLGLLADNGGPTLTHALLPGSPAIDAADDVICEEAPVSRRDQRGVRRVILRQRRGAGAEPHEHTQEHPDAEINVYRVVQESVNNVLRHSEATEARLTVRRTPSGVRLIVHDNGRGFATTRADGHGPRVGFGLAGIAERVTLLGGRADVRSAPGQGTTITVTFDLGGGRRVH